MIPKYEFKLEEEGSTLNVIGRERRQTKITKKKKKGKKKRKKRALASFREERMKLFILFLILLFGIVESRKYELSAEFNISQREFMEPFYNMIDQNMIVEFRNTDKAIGMYFSPSFLFLFFFSFLLLFVFMWQRIYGAFL